MTQTDKNLTFSNSPGFVLRGLREARKPILRTIRSGREKSQFDTNTYGTSYTAPGLRVIPRPGYELYRARCNDNMWARQRLGTFEEA